MITLKEIVAPGNIVKFTKYFDGQLWYQAYRVSYKIDAHDGHYDFAYSAIGPEFPVPISDIGNATFLAFDKAILFMRYIRKHLAMLEEASKST